MYDAPVPVALVDWDNTVRPGYTMRELCKYMRKRGCISQGDASEIEACFIHIDDNEVLAGIIPKLYWHAISGHTIDTLHGLACEFVSKSDYSETVYSPVASSLRLLNQSGIDISVVTGASAEVLVNLKNSMCISAVHGVEFRPAAEGKRVGLIPGTSDGKTNAVDGLLPKSDSKALFAFGDSKSDLPLFERARFNVFVKRQDHPPLNIYTGADELFHFDPSTQTVDELLDFIGTCLESAAEGI